jgi:Predicted glycosyltransferases
MSEPLVAIILVNYNGYSDTVECLKSIKAITYSNYHVIIVENSRDDRIKFKNDIFINQNSDVIYSK